MQYYSVQLSLNLNKNHLLVSLVVEIFACVKMELSMVCVTTESQL